MTTLSDIRNDLRQINRDNDDARRETKIRRLAPDDRYGFRLPIVFANNDYLLSADGAWSGVQVPHKPWGFLSQDEKERYWWASYTMFNHLFPADTENAGHLLVTNHVLAAKEWERALREKYADTATPAFHRYVQASREGIDQREFFERETYLFTRLGARGEGTGLRSWVRRWFETWWTQAGLDNSAPTDEERVLWSQQAETMADTFGGSWLAGSPIHRRRLEWLVRHLDTPGLPTPDVAPADDEEWGAGQWRTSLASYTREVDLGMEGKYRLRAVEMDGPTGTAYAAYLPLAHFPEQMDWSVNWLHHAARLPFPVDVSLRFEIIEPTRAEKSIETALDATQAQMEEDREAGVTTDQTTRTQHDTLAQVAQDIRMNRKPLARWQCVFAVYDTDKDELRRKVTDLKRAYTDLQIELVCPNLDQRELFYQSFPGGEILVQDWMHRSEPAVLASAMPWLTSEISDTTPALYQGYTLEEGRPARPFFHDLQNVVDVEGTSATAVVVGEPGQGKTVSLGVKQVHEDALRGVTQFVWDPKGDFLSLKRWEKRLLLDPSKVKVIDLYDPHNSVSLDPFGIAEVDPARDIDEREDMAINLLMSLMPRLVGHADQGLTFESMIQRAVSKVLAEEHTDGAAPTMQRVLATFRAWRAGDFSGTDLAPEDRVVWARQAQYVDLALSKHERSTLGRLLFRDPATSGSMKVLPGDLVIFVAMNLNPTYPGQQQTPKTLLADVISGLMVDYIRSLLYVLPDEAPKSLVFDEWHVIKRTDRAEALVDWLRRMGRSKRCMLRQLSQSATDFDTKSLAVVWCGRAANAEAAAASCALLGIEPTTSALNLLQSLTEKGLFLFRNLRGQVSLVKIDFWDPTLLDLFRTEAHIKAQVIQALSEANQITATGDLAEQDDDNTERAPQPVA